MKTFNKHVDYSGAAKGVALNHNARRLEAVGDVGDEESQQAMIPDATAKNLVALVKLLVPAVVAETLAAIDKRGYVEGMPTDYQPSAKIGKRIYSTGAELAAAVGVNRWTISAIRKTGKRNGDPLPRYSTADDVRAWLRRHPDFVARNAFKKPTDHRAQP